MRPFFFGSRMKQIAILVNPYLTRAEELYQPQRIGEELEALGAKASILKNAFSVHAERERFAEELSRRFDAAVYLDKDRYAPRVLEAHGMRLFDRAEAIELCDDKALTHIALEGLPMPRTYFAPLCYKGDAVPALGEVGEKLGFPLVVKECFGSFGEQVYLAKDGEELKALSERLKLRPHLYQEFIAESAGRDVRLICIGGEAVACMERRAEGDFRSNLARGGKGTPFSPTEEMRRLAREVCSRLRLDFCGIDFLLSKEGPLICEVNSNAFFGGIERETGVNVAGRYARHILSSIE